MNKLKYIILVLCALIYFGCKKNQLGGKSNIKGKVMHNSQAIPFAKIYIKFNATEAISDITSNYDYTMDADHNGNFLIEHIYHGDYYFYAAGADSFAVSKPAVKGGINLKVKRFKEVTGFEIPVQ